MNYVKLVTMSALLLAIPAVNANFITDSSAYKGLKVKLTQLKNNQGNWKVYVPEALIGGAAAYGLYNYVKPVRTATNNVVASADELRKDVFVRGNKKKQVIAGSTAFGLGVAAVLWKIGLHRATFGLLGKDGLEGNPLADALKPQA